MKLKSICVKTKEMYHFLIIFLILFLAFGIIRPKCTRTENPFSEPKFSWGLAATYSFVLTLIFGASLFLLVPGFKKSVLSTVGRTSNDNSPKTEEPTAKPSPAPVEQHASRNIVSGILGRHTDPSAPSAASSTTDQASSNRLSIRPFSI